MDTLVYKSVFGSQPEQAQARLDIYEQALAAGVVPASINDLYMARGAGQITRSFTVPAINVRGLTYDVARGIFAAARDGRVGALIFELARSEMQYTMQPPREYAPVIMAAAVQEKWQGSLFIQCDHFQAKAKEPGVPVEGELATIKKLVREALRAGMYNVDIDMSTLVNLGQSTEALQQEPNIRYTLELIVYIRNLERELGLSGITVSLGCEIGHIGGKNSTLADFRAFMEGLRAELPSDIVGVSKMSIQTGTSHGGVVLPDGTLQKVAVDFELLKAVSKAAKSEYGFGGAVQHGASTLPDDMLHLFPSSETLEIHFATGIQNMIMDHEAFPKSLLEEIYTWIDQTMASERGVDETPAQFHYKNRKKAWGSFKQQLWDMPETNKSLLRTAVQERFALLFEKLGVRDTMDEVREHVKPTPLSKTVTDFAAPVLEEKPDDVSGLSD